MVPFEIAWNWQKAWQLKLLNDLNSPQAVWLLEHPSCFTLGRGASEANLLFEASSSTNFLHRIDRGGEVTHHLPGQLVVYPVLDLRRYKTDLNWYLRQLEQVILDVMTSLNLSGERVNGLTGVWLEGAKVAAVGVGCRRWITQHGLALNINCELTGFNEIIPCGIKGCTVGKLSSWLPGLKVADVKPLIKDSLSNRFGLVWTD